MGKRGLDDVINMIRSNRRMSGRIDCPFVSKSEMQELVNRASQCGYRARATYEFISDGGWPYWCVILHL